MSLVVVDAENPFTVDVNYLDTDGYNRHFVWQTSTDSLKKLKNRIGIPDDVNWIEIGHPRMEVAPVDMPMGDNAGQYRGGRMKLVPNAKWVIYATSNDEEDEDGGSSWVEHTRTLTGKESLEVIEGFFLHPDFLGFQPKEGEFPRVNRKEDVNRLMEEIHRRFQSQELQSIGGWASNLPLNIKVLMAALLVVTLLTAIAGGIYPATVNWDRATNWMDGTYQNLLESVTSHPSWIVSHKKKKMSRKLTIESF